MHVIVKDADCYAVPAFFLKHVSYAEAFSLDAVFGDTVFLYEHVLDRFCTLVGETFVDFDRAVLRSITLDVDGSLRVVLKIRSHSCYVGELVGSHIVFA